MYIIILLFITVVKFGELILMTRTYSKLIIHAFILSLIETGQKCMLTHYRILHIYLLLV